ncbi:WGxxGxxG family protein [Gorillibacterium sp. sgz5001074]|uniref:WGxxGxxG family protein n=1 Tax=Gorillibacterium sp. sgz5001074 TaxID=3446695 RepID=UPI003F66A079
MRKTAAISAALALGLTLGGTAFAQGEADTTQSGGMSNYGTSGSSGTTGSNYSSGTTGTTGTVGTYDARTNSDLGTGILNYHGSRMFGNGANNGGGGTGMFGHGGFMGTTWGDGDHTNNGIHMRGTDGNRDGTTGTHGTDGTYRSYGTDGTSTGSSYTAAATDNDGIDWGWLGLLGLLGLAGLRSKREDRTNI